MRRSEGAPPAVLLGGQVNALSVARTLARAGVDVFALGEGAPFAPAASSRMVRRFVRFHADGLHDAWQAWLERAPEGAVVLPCGDEGLTFVARRRAALVDRGCRPVEANDELLLAMLDKAATADLVARAGVPAPRTEVVREAVDVERAAERFAFPCALKPRYSHEFARHFRVKAITVLDPEALQREAVAVLATGLDMLLTEIVPGPDSAFCSYYTYMTEDGPLLHATKRKLRQFPVRFGTGTFHETADEPDARRIGLRLFEHVGLRGIGNVEFKRDERDGTLKLIECNLRFTAANELLRRAGVDLARLAFRRAAGLPVEPADYLAPGAPRSGLHQWHPLDDTRAFVAYRRAGELNARSWVRSLAGPQVLPLFAADDVRPSAAHAAHLGRRVARLAVRKVRPPAPGSASG